MSDTILLGVILDDLNPDDEHALYCEFDPEYRVLSLAFIDRRTTEEAFETALTIGEVHNLALVLDAFLACHARPELAEQVGDICEGTIRVQQADDVLKMKLAELAVEVGR